MRSIGIEEEWNPLRSCSFQLILDVHLVFPVIFGSFFCLRIRYFGSFFPPLINSLRCFNFGCQGWNFLIDATCWITSITFCPFSFFWVFETCKANASLAVSLFSIRSRTHVNSVNWIFAFGANVSSLFRTWEYLLTSRAEVVYFTTTQRLNPCTFVLKNVTISLSDYNWHCIVRFEYQIPRILVYIYLLLKLKWNK